MSGRDYRGPGGAGGAVVGIALGDATIEPGLAMVEGAVAGGAVVVSVSSGLGPQPVNALAANNPQTPIRAVNLLLSILDSPSNNKRLNRHT